MTKAARKSSHRRPRRVRTSDVFEIRNTLALIQEDERVLRIFYLDTNYIRSATTDTMPVVRSISVHVEDLDRTKVVSSRAK
jgi:hypothetical protein